MSPVTRFRAWLAETSLGDALSAFGKAVPVSVALAVFVMATAAPSHAQTTKRLTVGVGGSATGAPARVVSTPAGIDCQNPGINGSVNCSFDFDQTSTVTLSYLTNTSVNEPVAEISSQWGGYVSYGFVSSVAINFSHWSLSGGYVDRTVQVAQVPLATLALNLAGSGAGRVVSSIGGLDCTASCTGRLSLISYYPNMAQVTLSAVPQSGSVFTGWSGQCSGSTATVALSMSDYTQSNVSCTARFDLAPTLTVATAGAGIGTLTSSPAGISCRPGSSGTCQKAWPVGTSVTLSATPDQGYSFAGWSGGCSGTGGTASVTLNSDTTCTATFVQGPDPTVSVSVAGGGTVASSPSGINCPGGSCSTTITWGSSLTLTAAAPGGGSFIEWGGACSGTSPSVTLANVKAATACSARFESMKRLTVSLEGSGVGQVTASSGGLICSSGSCSTDYAYNATVTLTATPTSGSTFDRWSGNCGGASPTTTVTMAADQNCTATFKSEQKRLTVTLAGTGRGVVTSAPAKISCSDVPAIATCSATFDTGTAVTLTATAETPSVENPYDESRFDGWSGACAGTAALASVTMSVAQSCTATFTKVKSSAVLTVTLAGSKSGTVTSTPAGMNCLPTTVGRQCQARYAKDTAISLTVVPETGARFLGWSGACTGRASPFALTMSEAKSCTATFGVGPIAPETGSWWNAAESGRGYGIEVQYTDGDPKIFFGAFAYTPSGPPIWYIAFLTPNDDGSGFSGTMTSYRGGQTLLGAYQAATGPTTVGVAGQALKLAFTSTTAGTITFPPLTAFSTSSTVAITRFPIVSSGLSNPRATSPTLPQTGWWWNTAEPGRGTFFEAQADAAGNQVLFTLFFLYGSDGSPRWYFGSTALASAGSSWTASSMDLYECSGGQAIGSLTPEIAECAAVTGGGTTVQFSSAGTTATMTLSTGATVALQRFAF